MSGIAVTIAYASASAAEEQRLVLPDTATLADALDRVRADAGFGAAIAGASAFGVWGKVRPLETRLREGDRVEIYRALQADPKDARRARARR